MGNLEIREANVSDVPEIMKLIGQADMSPDNQLTESDARQLFEGIVRTGCHKIYVASLGASVVGTFALVLIQSLTHNGGRSVVVEDVVVKKEFQGQGLGREMMRAAAEAAKELGGEKLVLSSGKGRIQAHAFYEHLQYKKDGYRFMLSLKEDKQ